MDDKVISNIKSLGVDMINKAGSGHPGILLGASSIIYALYKDHLNIYPSDPIWLGRDRFVLSAGHGSSMLYAINYMAKMGLDIEDLKNFRQIDSKTPGHPEYGVTKFIETTTGPLGQGVSNAVGMAISALMLKSKFKIEQNKSLFDYNVYVLIGDGDLMEGVALEALSLAGNMKLDNLIVLYDSNNVTLDGKLEKSFSENSIDKFRAMGFYTALVDGESVEEVSAAIKDAKAQKLPSFIECKTIIGRDSIKEDTNLIHGKPLEKNDIALVKKKLGLPNEDFYVDQDIRELFSNHIKTRVNSKYINFLDDFNNLDEVQKSYFETKNINFDEINISSVGELRNINGNVLDEISNFEERLISLSADLFSSTKTYLNSKGDFSKSDRTGRNIWCGVREHAMAGIANGMALTNFIPVTSTFLSFADYMKPSMRLAALMNIKVLYTFTHDSISIGADGATHQPVEQLAMLRSIPNFNVFRPADCNELLGCYKTFMNEDKPSALVVTKSKISDIPGTNQNKVSKGAYIVSEYKNQLHGIIIATGDDVELSLKVQEKLFNQEKLDFRVVSMPSQCLFLKQDAHYKEQILPKGVRVCVIEKATSFGWHRFVLNENYLITVDDFGHSGTSDDILKKMNFDYDSIVEKIKSVYK